MGCNIPRPWKRPPTPPMYDPPKKEHVTNCPNCCAVITGPICEYCGTRFQTLADKTIDEIVIPIYVGGDRIGEVVKQNRTQFRSGGD